MTTATPTFIESVEAKLGTELAFVFCSAGELPLEWPIAADGSAAVTDAPIVNGKRVAAAGTIWRNIDTRRVDDRGVGAQSQGYQALDVHSKVRTHRETDAQFLARIEDWIENSDDPRIERYGVRVEQGNPYPIPFGNWDKLTPESILVAVQATEMGDDHAENLSKLHSFAAYELRRKYVDPKDPTKTEQGARQDVLDGLEMLAEMTGDESSDDSYVID